MWENLSNINGHKSWLRCHSHGKTQVKRFSISCPYHLRAKGNVEEILVSLWERAGGSIMGHLSILWCLEFRLYPCLFPYLVLLAELPVGCISPPGHVFLLNLSPAYLHFICLKFSLWKQHWTQQLRGSDRKWETRIWALMGSLILYIAFSRGFQ